MCVYVPNLIKVLKKMQSSEVKPEEGSSTHRKNSVWVTRYIFMIHQDVSHDTFSVPQSLKKKEKKDFF